MSDIGGTIRTASNGPSPGEVARRFFAVVAAEARRRRLLPEERLTVDETLLEAWASMKSFCPRDEDRPSSRDGEFVRSCREMRVTPGEGLVWLGRAA